MGESHRGPPNRRQNRLSERDGAPRRGENVIMDERRGEMVLALLFPIISRWLEKTRERGKWRELRSLPFPCSLASSNLSETSENGSVAPHKMGEEGREVAHFLGKPTTPNAAAAIERKILAVSQFGLVSRWLE